MLRRWWQGLQRRRDDAAVLRRPIPEDLWKRTLIRYPFLQRRDPADAAELRRLTSLFLDRKEFSGAGGLRVTDAMAVTVAAQACLPVLRLGLDNYDGFVGVVLHPDQVVAQRESIDESGVVHRYEEVLAGEAVQGGPLMLSWSDVRLGSGAHAKSGLATPGYNVVLHEFAHVLDMATGAADGMPALPPELPAALWQRTMGQAFEDFLRLLEQAEMHAQDRTAEAAPTALDPYGASGPEEFFAVASEAFFVTPTELRSAHPALYALLVRYFQQDPEMDRPPPGRRP